MSRGKHAVFIIFLGVVLALACAVKTAEVTRFLSDAERTMGKVVSVGSVNVNDEGYPVHIVFSDTRSVQHLLEIRTHRAPTGSLTHHYREGAAIEIVYAKAEPAHTARVGRFLELWNWPLVWGACALGAVVSALFMFSPKSAGETN